MRIIIEATTDDERRDWGEVPVVLAEVQRFVLAGRSITGDFVRCWGFLGDLLGDVERFRATESLRVENQRHSELLRALAELK